ncbi:amino acid/polyamine transporter I [Coniella lustricola]|uniref:Amino acid/polyamine transporter I n=1 Tax=Coniella lustricola TaxID=2025994 RepID=A0A2T3A4W4_9PEZI|nr:amino acid/polyamine transporter I [Coniella lustricola]
MEEPTRPVGGSHHDATALEKLGVKQELQRNFSRASMLGLAFAILNSWTALATSLSLALPSGGASAILWGLIVAGLCNLCLAASLAEFLSAYPTAGGQYHWAAIISWKRFARAISYCTGWINVAAWVCLTATGGLLGSQLILGVISLMHESYESKPWHQFLIYIAYTLAAFFINAFMNRLLPYFNKAALLWSLAGFVIISITVLACGSPNYQSGSFVFGGFINQSGWPDGLSWLLGLLQGAFALTGFDATIHMIEEIPRPQIEGPRIMIACILIGMFTGFIFLVCLLFVITDVDAAIESAAGPLLQILYDATSNKAGAVCLLMFPIVCMLFTTTSIMTTSSRMSYAFARDRGLPFSRVFAKVHPGLDVPLNALIWTAVWVIIFGCVFLGSSSAFNAITAASVVALGVTYAIPPAINVLRGRKMLPESRAFKLPNWLGWFCNLVGIAWTLLTTVLFVFPPDYPVTPDNMNYAVVPFGVVLVIATIQWIFDGRKNYEGPHIDADALSKGIVEGITGVESQHSAEKYVDTKATDS